ncbi:MAG: response regulator [Deltaproteobacteria bacterium]|nr:response regulator [Deltaproteobacteria bacterium]
MRETRSSKDSSGPQSQVEGGQDEYPGTQDLRDRDRLLQATAESMSRLLAADSLSEGVQAALRVLGEAVRADRVYIFQNIDDPSTGAFSMAQRHEWCAAGVVPQIDSEALLCLPYADGFLRWQALLSAGEAVDGVVRAFPECERGVLESQDIRSILVLPIDLKGRFWGFIGFDDCRSERAWSSAEASILRVAAVGIGYAYLRAEADEALRSAEDRYRSLIKMQAIGQITGGVAHDFNNLLTVIISNMSMVVEAVDDPEIRAMAVDVLSAAERGGELTNHLLAFSRRQALNPRPLALNGCLDRSIKLIRRTMSESIELDRCFASDLWTIHCDVGQLENALLNLAINARDAMPSGGKLTFETENVRVQAPIANSFESVAPGEYVVLSIRDTGRGMSPDVLKRAFEPFFTTKDVGRGTGLGLSMVYGFVRQSGGYATLESNEDAGTDVRLYFPRFVAAPRDDVDLGGDRASDGIAVERSDALRRSERILVVEDDAPVRRGTVRALSRFGYEVIEAENGARALAMLGEGLSVDLVFSDITMPGGVSGFDVAGAVAERFPNVGVLLTTGYTDLAVPPSDGEREAPEILQKPFCSSELGRAIRRALDRMAVLRMRRANPGP